MATNTEEPLTPETYDLDFRGRYHCVNCGYVSVHQLDLNNTEFLDLHCKCGAPVVRVPMDD